MSKSKPSRRCSNCTASTARIRQRDPLLIAGRHQNFEGEGGFGRALPQYRPVKIVASLRQQLQSAAERCAIAARAVADGKAVAAVENIGGYVRNKWLQQLPLAVASSAAIRR